MTNTTKLKTQKPVKMPVGIAPLKFSTFACVFIINQSDKIRGRLVSQIGAANHIKPQEISMDEKGFSAI